jgi:predicted secreted protein
MLELSTYSVFTNITETDQTRLAMKFLIVPLLLALPVLAIAHETTDHYDRVNLSASAQTRIENDTITATLYAQEEGSDAVQLANRVNKRINQAVELVKQHDAIKLQTNNYSTSPVYHNNKITGWRVRQSIRLESQDMTLVSRVLGDLQQTVALEGINFSVSPGLKNSTDDELIVEALKVFEKRAKNISQQLKRKNYKIVDINVSTAANHYARRNYEVAAMASKVSAPSIEGGEQTVQVTISGQIELE